MTKEFKFNDNNMSYSYINNMTMGKYISWNPTSRPEEVKLSLTVFGFV